VHLLRGLKRLESRLRRQARRGRSYFERYVNVSCWPPAPPSGPSIRVTCVTSIGASCGWSLLTDRAAHSDTHSRLQPHEHVTSQRGFPVVVNRSWSAAASGATSYKPTSRPLALPRPLRVPTEHPGSSRSGVGTPGGTWAWHGGRATLTLLRACARRPTCDVRTNCALTGFILWPTRSCPFLAPHSREGQPRLALQAWHAPCCCLAR